jgi:hypothetical protein
VEFRWASKKEFLKSPVIPAQAGMTRFLENFHKQTQALAVISSHFCLKMPAEA